MDTYNDAGQFYTGNHPSRLSIVERHTVVYRTDEISDGTIYPLNSTWYLDIISFSWNGAGKLAYCLPSIHFNLVALIALLVKV